VGKHGTRLPRPLSLLGGSRSLTEQGIKQGQHPHGTSDGDVIVITVPRASIMAELNAGLRLVQKA
jgi:hypothetical protein